jgi:hypothetical protein
LNWTCSNVTRSTLHRLAVASILLVPTDAKEWRVLGYEIISRPLV